ncbi:hypothetical protein [Streptomyces bullii]|uniref:Uncharacterized protein n=1 Tax=Streptomyces bullii TaxID=349910 RepID=A0ABW0USC2_9ACTN
MHEMWCGPDASGQPVWHLLTADRTGTLCGVGKQEDSRRREPTDKHCFPCMATLQAVMQPTGAAAGEES